MLAQLCFEALESFKTRLEQSLRAGIGFASCVHICTQSCMLEFDQGCEDAAIRQANWDASNVRDKLRGGVDEHASAVRSSQLAKLRTTYEEQVRRDLKDPVKSLLREGSPEDAWASIRNRLESLTAVSEFSNAINKFNLDQAAVDTRVQEIRDYARSLVKQVAREACEEVLILMKQRFFDKLYPDTDSRPSFWRPSFWTNRKDIATITMDACSEALKLLSVMTAIRLTERQDNISHLLFSSLIVDPSSQDITVGVPTNCLGLSTWEEVSLEDTLLTPRQCTNLWNQFLREIQNAVNHATSSQDASSTNRWLNSGLMVVRVVAGVAMFAVNSRNRTAVFLVSATLEGLIRAAENYGRRW